MHHVAPPGAADAVLPSRLVSVPLAPLSRAVWRIDDGASRTTPIVPGRIFVGGTQRLAFSEIDDPADCVHLAIADAPLRTAAEALEWDGTPALGDAAWSEDDVVFHLAGALRAEILGGQLAGALFGESIVTALAVHLLRRYGDRPVRRDGREGAVSPAMQRRVVAHVEERLSEPITLAEMAASVHLTPFHFLRRFKAATGVPPHRFVMHRRLERAKELLRVTDLPLAEIAWRTGFASPSHFTAVFRRSTGSAPGAWRTASSR
jgi:AraC family transcriptional regulator